MGANRIVLNEDTGEQEYKFKPGDRIVIAEQSKYIAEHKMNFNSDSQFVKFYSDIVPLLIKYLSATEIKMIVALIPLTKYEDCTIEKTISGHSKILDIQGIAENTGLDYDFVKRYMRSLRSKGVIGCHETGSIIPDCDSKHNKVYTVNPYIFFNGKNVNKTLYMFYEKSGWRELLTNSSNDKL